MVNKQHRRVVITGMGTVSPLGPSTAVSWNNLVSGQSGIGQIPERLMRTDDISCRIAGFIPTPEEDPVRGLDPAAHIDRSVRGDRFIQLGLIAADEAITDANLSALNPQSKERTGTLVGSGIGGLPSIEENSLLLKESGPRRISPFFIPASLSNLLPGYISMKYGFYGTNFSVASACATGSHAIGEAAAIIQRDDADVMICGGAEAAICRIGLAGFAAARSLSTRYNDAPHKASRPWDKDRDGFVMAEGAGILVLEELEHALNRGATIYAELIGYGASSDAYHITAPEPSGKGAHKAMDLAVRQAAITPEQIQYINAHATSTSLGDKAEAQAIRQLYSGYDSSRMYVSGTKSSMGHALGAAGSIESIFSILSIVHNTIPGTLNLDQPDEDYGLNILAHESKTMQVEVAMSNSFGFGGTNTALIFKRYTSR